MTPCAAEVWRRLYADTAPMEWPAPLEESVEGWNGDHPALWRMIDELSTRNDWMIIVDVGVWKGQSTLVMADRLRTCGINGCVIAVDTFLTDVELWRLPDFKRVNARPDIYERFLGNVTFTGLRDYVVPMPQTSFIAAQILEKLQIRSHLVHVDASHDYLSTMNDALVYWERLTDDGIMIGDDYHETDWPGVFKAAHDFSRRVKRELEIDPPKWILRKGG